MIIDWSLENNVIQLERIYDQLKSEYPDLFHASAQTVRSYVALKKKELVSTQIETYLPLSHPQGKSQADFGEAVAYEKGKLIKVYSLNVSSLTVMLRLPNSSRNKNRNASLRMCQIMFAIFS